VRKFPTSAVQNHLQYRRFASGSIRGCSPSFAWVDVLLVYRQDFEDRQDEGDPHDANDNCSGRAYLRVRTGKVDRKFGLSVNSPSRQAMEYSNYPTPLV
jgi:hypothetical protein